MAQALATVTVMRRATDSLPDWEKPSESASDKRSV
jgi:hypothetical protein